MDLYATSDVQSSGMMRRDLDQFGVTEINKIHENCGSSVFFIWDDIKLLEMLRLPFETKPVMYDQI